MDFLSHRDGGMFSCFLNYRNCKRLREFEEIEISRKSYRGGCDKQGGKLLTGFRPRIRPQGKHKTVPGG